MNSTTTSSTAQFLIVLVIFAGVLLVTFFVTKWMAGYQKGKRSGTNIELVESAPLTNNKHIQIVRIGAKYVALAISKDDVTKVCELSEEELVLTDDSASNGSFKDVWAKIRNSESSVHEEE